MKRFLGLILVLMLAVSAIACGSKSMDAAAPEANYDKGWGYDSEITVEEPMVEEDAVVSTTGTLTDVELTEQTERKIIKNANLTVETLEFDAFLPDLEQMVADLGGYMESTYVDGNRYSYSYGLRYASMTVRIPAEKLEAFLNHIAHMSNVLSKSVVADDVTTKYVDIESRLSVLRDEKTALSNILANATETADIIAVQSQLYDVIEEIESYEAILRSMDSKIAYSTVYLEVEEVREPTPTVEETRGEELKRRWNENLEDLGEGFTDFGIWFVVKLPNILLVLAVMAGIFFLVFGIVKGIKKRRAKKRAKAEQK